MTLEGTSARSSIFFYTYLMGQDVELCQLVFFPVTGFFITCASVPFPFNVAICLCRTWTVNEKKKKKKKKREKRKDRKIVKHSRLVSNQSKEIINLNLKAEAVVFYGNRTLSSD